MSAPSAPAVSLARAAVTMTRELIRIDTSNGMTIRGESVAAALVAATLTRAGGAPQVLAGAAGRDNVVVRVAGRSPGPGIVVHAHLDTVPADPEEWQADPWSADVKDGCIVGRGAVDMKAAAGSMLAVATGWLARGVRPAHDVVFAWLADEEAGGRWGAKWLTRRHSALFYGCDTAIGEVGGFAVPLRPGRTVYPLMTAERGHAVVELRAHRRAGHAATAGGARGDALTELAGAVAAIGSHAFTRHPTRAGEGFRQGVAGLLRLPPNAGMAALGPLARLVEPGMRGSAIPTVFRAGTAANVSPSTALAVLDCRFVPGHREEFFAELAALVPDGMAMSTTPLSPGFDRDLSGRVVDGAAAALLGADPDAVVVPYGVAAATDGPAFAALGMCPLGFTPLGLPAGFPLGELFHGVDERVPLSAVEFGAQVLAEFLSAA